jgi:hypothetical protein
MNESGDIAVGNRTIGGNDFHTIVCILSRGIVLAADKNATILSIIVQTFSSHLIFSDIFRQRKKYSLTGDTPAGGAYKFFRLQL